MPATARKCGSKLEGSRSLGSDRLLDTTPSPPSWWACALQEFYCPPPGGGVAVHYTSCIAHYPRIVGVPCIARVALPVAPRQSGSASLPRAAGSALQKFH